MNGSLSEEWQHRCFVDMGVKISELVQAAGQQGQDFHDAVAEGESGDSLSGEEIATALQEADSDGDDPAEPAEDVAAPQQAVDGTAETQTADPQQLSSAPAAQQSPESRAARPPVDVDLDLLLDIPLEIKVELGRTRIQIQEMLKLAPGAALKLVKLEGEPVDILANDTLIARGEVVVQNEKYGIRVTEITSRIERIRSFSI